MSEWPDQKLQRSELALLSEFEQELTAAEHINNIAYQLQQSNVHIAVPPPPNSAMLGQFTYADSDSDSQSLLVVAPPPQSDAVSESDQESD